jgi:two-component system response regulator AtoC
MKILVVDDDRGHRKSLTLILGDAGYEVGEASDGEEGLEKAFSEHPQLILCDVRMAKKDGIQFLKEYREAGGEALVVVMTAYGGMDLAMKAMKLGAYDYLPKPFGADEVLLAIRKAEERENLRREVGRLRSEVRAERRFGEIIAGAPAMIRALEVAGKVARHPSSVLLSGASGTGKELVARLIHRESDRAERPFIPVNCGAIPETLLESEFFGYVRGAFTGAERDREGLFEAATGGTLFLDEVGELPLALQVKLLRALQEGEIRRLGEQESVAVDVRIIAASNRDLESMVGQGEFREDLYYRLAVVPIHLPPLHRRKEEIPDLVNYFLAQHRERLGVQVERVAPKVMEAFLSYSWPGNIRELENLLERLVVLADGTALEVTDLPEGILRPKAELSPVEVDDDDLSVKHHGAVLEKVLIQRAMDRTAGNKTQAAELLELSPRALRYKIKDYGLE